MYNLIAKFKKYGSLAVIYLFNCLPIQNNKIFLFSYYGSQYGGNPKYISEYIIEHFPKDKFEVVWAFNDMKSRKHLNSIRKVKTMSLRYFYNLCTSKVIITNYRTTEFFIKRKNQYYIQTWHSSLRLKQIEKDAEDVLPPHYVQMAKKDSLKCDLLLSGCEFSTNIFQRAFWYEGEIFEHGTPRNDFLIHHNFILREEIFERLKIPADHKVILYAPTFRKDNGLDVYDLNYSEILKSTKKKFGGEWTLLVRLHPHLISKSSQLIYGDNTIDVTTYDDISELLSIANVLISDYSSLMFDFSITKRPCFLYVPDVIDYITQDRKLYFNLRDLPFISATSNDELLGKIDTFNEENYRRNLERFSHSIGTFEDGKACEHLVNRIYEICYKDEGDCL